MKKESKRGIALGLIGIVVLCGLAFIVSFVADTYTIPVANEASLAQVNGGDEEFVEMRTTNKVIETTQNIVWPVAGVLSIWIIIVVTVGALKREGGGAKNR